MIEQDKPLSIEPSDKTEESTNCCRILVVDDNEASAKTLGWMMEAMGHEARLAYNGRDALAVVREFCPDVVLLDIGMPDMNGYELCQEMRRMPMLKEITYIAQTGWGQEQHRKRSKEAGFDLHLTKPISFEVLQRQLENIRKSQSAS